jgi:hypothetical protein
MRDSPDFTWTRRATPQLVLETSCSFFWTLFNTLPYSPNSVFMAASARQTVFGWQACENPFADCLTEPSSWYFGKQSFRWQEEHAEVSAIWRVNVFLTDVLGCVPNAIFERLTSTFNCSDITKLRGSNQLVIIFHRKFSIDRNPKRPTAIFAARIALSGGLASSEVLLGLNRVLGGFDRPRPDDFPSGFRLEHRFLSAEGIDALAFLRRRFLDNDELCKSRNNKDAILL